jgi:hypothetical protein
MIVEELRTIIVTISPPVSPLNERQFLPRPRLQQHKNHIAITSVLSVPGLCMSPISTIRGLAA